MQSILDRMPRLIRPIRRVAVLAIRVAGVSLVLVGVAVGSGLRAQAPRRLPIIAGNGMVHVLVAIDGTVSTWGYPRRVATNPSLGDGTRPGDKVDEPRLLAGVGDIIDAAVGDTQVLLLKRDGTVLAWGWNSECEVGTGDGKTKLAPVPIAGLRNVRQIAAGKNVSGALLEDGTVWLWGWGQKGQLANGLWGWQTPCAKVPTKVEGLTGVKKLSLGDVSALALKDDGTVWGWGTNANGELCDGTTDHRPRPVQMKGISNAVDAVVEYNSIVVLADGTVRMCGVNQLNALGDPAEEGGEQLTPYKVPGLTGVRSARMNSTTTIVQLADGTLRGWGMGYYGALGDGGYAGFTAKPHPPTGLGPVLVHYMSGGSSYAIRADGTVMAWCIPTTSGNALFVLVPTAVFTVKLSE
jgi:alpha-tubulin suppressor-like RCC1 family protein